MRSAPARRGVCVMEWGGGVSGTGGVRNTQHNSSSSTEGAADVRDPAQRPEVISRGYFFLGLTGLWGFEGERKVAKILCHPRRGIRLLHSSVMGIDRQRRASLALTLNFVALFLAVSALTTSYWCEGTRKVVKPFCTGPVTTKQSFCIRFNSSNLNDTRLVQYIWETGEDKYVMRKFHTGIWFSCEQNVNMTGKFVEAKRPERCAEGRAGGTAS